MEEKSKAQNKISRRDLFKITGAAAVAAKIGYGDQRARAENENKPSELWGKLVNSEYPNDITRSAFFFAGPPNPESNLQNLNPATEWNEENIPKIFDEMKTAGINSVDLSWWGSGEEYKKWSPTLCSEETIRRVFKETSARKMLVAPVLEVSPDFEFWKEFPQSTQNLEKRIISLLNTYGNEESWEKMYDKEGGQRHVIKLIETIHESKIDPEVFAQAFDRVADTVFSKTGYKVGFVIDPTPLPASGSYEGPKPDSLKKTSSILAINPYNIFSDGETEPVRIENAEKILSFWHDSGIPLIVPLITGYDDTHFRTPGQKFGYSEEWFLKLRILAGKYQTAGIRFDNWNAVTEGSAVEPTLEHGNLSYEFAMETAALFNEQHHRLFVPQIGTD